MLSYIVKINALPSTYLPYSRSINPNSNINYHFCERLLLSAKFMKCFFFFLLFSLFISINIIYKVQINYIEWRKSREHFTYRISQIYIDYDLSTLNWLRSFRTFGLFDTLRSRKITIIITIKISITIIIFILDPCRMDDNARILCGWWLKFVTFAGH